MSQGKFCRVCDKRVACIAPCERLLRHLDTITGKQKELTVGRVQWSTAEDMAEVWGSTCHKPLSLREKAIATLYFMRFTRDELTQLFNIKRSTLRKDLWRIRKKMRS